MRYQYRIADPFHDLLGGFRKGFCVAHHIIGDLRLAGDVGRNGLRRLYEHLDALGSHAVGNLDRTEFNDGIILAGQSGRFQVIHNMLQVIDILVCTVVDNVQMIIGQVDFTAQTDLEPALRMFLVQR